MAGIRLLHTADVHLGAPFGFLGPKGAEQRAQLKATFSRVVDLALTSQADLLLVAGDLFDSPTPHAGLVGEVIYQLGRLESEGIWTLIVPGTHDRIQPGGIYERKDLASLSMLHVFREREITPFQLDALDLTVYGRATSSEGRDVLAGFKASGDSRWRVGMLHASVALPARVKRDEMLVSPESISACGLDYLALGHWHGLADYSGGPVPAFYSGPPEPLAMGEGEEGRVILVELDQGAPARVNPIPVGRRRFRRTEVDAGEIGGPSELYAFLRERADRDLGLEVELKGAWGEEWADFDWEAMEDDLAPLFFHFRLRPESGGFSPREVEAYPEKTVIGRFVRRAAGEMAGRQGEDRLVAEMALRLGLAHLGGGYTEIED